MPLSTGTFRVITLTLSVADNLRQLQAAVVEQRADLGIAFDGDGDRIGLVDSSGAIVWPDQLLLLLALDARSSSGGCRGNCCRREIQPGALR